MEPEKPCKLFHKWQQCVCVKCGTTRHKVEGCICTRCGSHVHELDTYGCSCVRCGEIVHEWDGCYCKRCSATNHQFENHVCIECGADEDSVEKVSLSAGNAMAFGFKQGLYIQQHPCWCGGDWIKGTISSGQDATYVDCTCNKCGRKKEFVFNK